MLWGMALAVIVLAAFFGGMLVERLRLDAKRDEVIQRYNRVAPRIMDLAMSSIG